MELTNSQVDKLGERLREGTVSEADLRLLDAFRRTFTDAYESVLRRLRERLHLEPTGRPAKSTTSITDKLKRESIRLTQMQDIAGCRVVVSTIRAQDALLLQLVPLFADAEVVDRRERPSFGYRAVHVIVREGGRPIELQIRTEWQHLWAELSEKCADVFESSIKYGGGDARVRDALATMSEVLASFEKAESAIDLSEVSMVTRATDVPEEVRLEVAALIDEIELKKVEVRRIIIETIAGLAPQRDDSE